MAGAHSASPESIVTGDKNDHPTWRGLLRPIVNVLVLPWWSCNPILPFLSGLSQELPTVTGTLICPQSDKVRLCLQVDPTDPPFLMLDLPLGTCDLAAEIEVGACRIALECERPPEVLGGGDEMPLLGEAAWAVYLNGRKRAGFAGRRNLTEKEAWLLGTMRTVTAGAGILHGKKPEEGVYTYLRGRFERVVGSADSESYHLVDPTGCLGQELSFFFLRV